MKSFISKILSLIHGKFGEQIRLGISVLVGMAATWINSKFGIEVPEDKQLLVVTLITGAVLTAINSAAQFYNASQTEKIQEVVNSALPASQEIPVDGWAGPQTVKAVVKAVAVSE
jgi:hypothetical protein